MNVKLEKNTKRGLLLVASTVAGLAISKPLKTNPTITSLCGLALGLIVADKVIK
jgi:hypothetical protein